jgi:[acyl-carrier-protein] S-malonyltransferase
MTALLFPGQGTQRVGMGAILFRRFAETQALLSEASLAAGIDIGALLRRGPAKVLSRTIYAQVAVTTVNVAALQILRRSGVRYDAVAGHSVGAIAALAAADILTPAEAVRLAAQRGSIMNSIGGEGAMLSVTGISPSTAQDILGQVTARLRLPVVVGLVNGPQNVVISGAAEAVSFAAREFREAGALSVRALDVSHAFHSPLMKPARRAWQELVRTVPLKSGRVPVVADTTGQALSRPRDVRDFLISQLTGQVRWDLVCGQLIALGQCDAIEAGDSTMLRSLGRAYQQLHVASMTSGLIFERLRAAYPAPAGTHDPESGSRTQSIGAMT